MERFDINEKVICGKELTSEEVSFIFYNYDSVAERSGEHHRWWYPVYKIFQVEEKFFQVWGAIGLTESKEDDFVPQVAIEMKQREKIISEWVPVDEEQ